MEEIKSHLDHELIDLKKEVVKMWVRVISQLEKSANALDRSDKDLAHEILYIEKKINAHELKIDSECENIIALFNPVAIDLRNVLATLKINANLERIADNAESIAKFIVDADGELNHDLLDKTRVVEMNRAAQNMLEEVLRGYEEEDTTLARKVFQMDEILDHINFEATGIIADYLRAQPDDMKHALYVLSIIRKLERVGDQCKNIAEEIIFFIDAKVLKHKKKSN